MFSAQKNLWPFVLLVLSPFFVHSQKRAVLDWAFFKNDKPANAEHQAFTCCNLAYRYNTIKSIGEKMEIQFTVTFKMDTSKSYFETNKRILNDVRLLNHEQGHADIGFIYAIKLKDTFEKTSFLRKDYQAEIKNIWTRIFAEMTAAQLKYDAGTNHSKNLEEQKKWDQYFINIIGDSQ
jgi:hypothetical protein